LTRHEKQNIKNLNKNIQYTLMWQSTTCLDLRIFYCLKKSQDQ